MAEFSKGQCWISEPEPELGVGVVVETSPGRVSLLFRASGTVRQYATDSAPIKRVEFRAGDTIKTHTGESVLVDSVETSREGMFIYVSGGRKVPETDLSDTLSFSKPEERLVAGQVDEPRDFDLRLECLRRRHQIRHSPVRGFIGARIDLIPHQLSVAHEVASRLLPRVLLADEVGLGKTIEASLVVHRLFRSGRAGRILILVPEPLVHQWFVELLRRFSLRVSIFDEERCRAIEAGGGNPFLDDQLILCPLSLLAAEPKRASQAAEAGWDLIVVDEVHHLAWSPGLASTEYLVVESLARQTPGLILLTATPEQSGAEGHFARLRLLDPDRYNDFDRFTAERSTFRQTAKIAAKILDGKPLTLPDAKILRQICQANPARLEEHLAALKKGASTARESLVRELLDQHGPGRVMFRNTRAAIKGFPKRRVILEALAPCQKLMADEWASDNAPSPRSYPLADDPRVAWLVRFLQKKRDAKVLLICRTREKVLALDAALRAQVTLKQAMFHEELTLLQRDRNAAWFAEADGAQILLCSEIGSEGRNFQFAHHLVLFDLPAHPDLLEQRIGRLDRIGQTETISIHVPYPQGSHLEVLARWFHEGLNAFEKSLEGGAGVMAKFGKRLAGLIDKGAGAAGFEKLLTETKAFHLLLAEELEQGQDRLLQMNSCQPETAARVIEQIEAFDKDTGLEDFLLRLFDHYGVDVEELAARTWLAKPAALTKEAFPELPEAGITLTADRGKALSREDMGFLSWDHPIVSGGIDLLLGSGQGSSAFAIRTGGDGQGIFLETVFVIDPVAPPALHVDRFLPATPVRMVVDATGRNVSVDMNLSADDLEAGSVFPLLDNTRIKNKLLPAMLEKSRQHAADRAVIIAAQAAEKMRASLGAEIERLRDLKKSNDHIRDEEITLLESQMAELDARITEAPLRLDAVRLIWQKAEN